MSLVRIRVVFLGESKTIKVNTFDSISTIIQAVYSQVLNNQSNLPSTDDEITRNYSFSLSTRPLITDLNDLSRELKSITNSKRFELRVVKNTCGGTSLSFPTWVETQTKECVVFGDDHTCAKLECGCFISFEGVRNFVETVMDENEVLICKGCGKLLTLVDDIVQMCSFDETKENKCYSTLTKRHRTYVKKNGQVGNLGDAQCPHCVSINRRVSVIAYKMQCSNCRKYFCYECEETWKKSGTVLCGNNGCNTMDIQNELTNCDPLASDNGRSWVTKLNDKFAKNDDKKKIPAYRACIKCWNLSTVVSNCRHITCNECQMYYCFACLKPMAGHKDEDCDKQPPAPRQILN